MQSTASESDSSSISSSIECASRGHQGWRLRCTACGSLLEEASRKRNRPPPPPPPPSVPTWAPTLTMMNQNAEVRTAILASMLGSVPTITKSKARRIVARYPTVVELQRADERELAAIETGGGRTIGGEAAHALLRFLRE